MMAALLTDMLKGRHWGTKPVTWTKQAEMFTQLKVALRTYPVLHSPLPDKPFTVHTDASKVGLGAVLAQQAPQGLLPQSRANAT